MAKQVNEGKPINLKETVTVTGLGKSGLEANKEYEVHPLIAEKFKKLQIVK